MTRTPRVNAMRLENLLPLLQCPKSGESLTLDGDRLVSSAASYPFEGGIPDLRMAPPRFRVDLPWVDVSHSVGIHAGEFEYFPNLTFPPNPDRRLSSLVPLDGRGKRLLEVGCGARDCEQFFQSHGFEYIAADYEKRGIGPHLLVDAHRLPFKDNVIDVYYSNSVYEHLTSPLVAALEAKRVLRKRGIFWGSTAFMYGFHDHASYFHMSHAGVLLTLKQAGFTNIKLLPGWDYPAAVASSAFGANTGGWPWEKFAHFLLWLLDSSYIAISNAARVVTGRTTIDMQTRKMHLSGGIGFAATVDS